MVEWINSHRSALQIRGRISELAERWHSEGRSQDLLLPEGKQLDEAQSLLTLTSFSLSIDEQALIAASSVKARRRKNLGRGVMFVIMMLALLSIALGLSAMSAKKQAQERRVEAEGLMGYMLGEFVDKLRPIGKLDLLDSVGEKALSYFAKSGEEDLSSTALTQRARALQVLATTRIERGDSKAALDALELARKTLRTQLAENPNDQQVLKTLGENAFYIAQIYFDKSDFDRAIEFHRQYRDYSDILHKIDPDNVEWWIEQSYAHNSLGTDALKKGDFITAEKEFQLSLELKLRALEKRPKDTDLIRTLADTYSWQGTVQQNLGHLEDALVLYEKKTKILGELWRTSKGNTVFKSDWAMSLLLQAILEKSLGREAESIKLFQLAQKLFDELLGAVNI